MKHLLLLALLAASAAACASSPEQAATENAEPDELTSMQLVETSTGGAWDGANCEQIEDWIAEHIHALPRTYDDIITLPSAYRIRVYEYLSPTEKANLWRAQIERYRSQHELSKEQVHVLDEASDMLRPALFEQPDLWEAETLRITEAAKRAFGAETTKALFVDLGVPSDVEYSGPGANPPDVADNDTSDLYAPYTPYCACSTLSDWCWVAGKTCKAGVIKCIPVKGCGTLLNRICNGICMM